MRLYLVVLALLLAPAISVAQTDAVLPGNSSCDNGQGDENRSDSGTVNAHQGLCVLDPPPPPPTCGQAPAPAGTAVITGQVFQDVSPDFPGLANWCVDLSGPVSGSMLTDATGHYSFSGLPGGSYTVCVEVQTGWTQTFPSSGTACPGGIGWTFDIGDGSVAEMIDFGNVAL